MGFFKREASNRVLWFVAVVGFAATAVALPPRAPPPRRHIPKALLAIESAAEDAYDSAISGALPSVARTATAIDKAWAAYRSTALADGATAATLTGMDEAVAGLRGAPHDVLGAGRAANHISSFMKELLGLYRAKVPTPIMQLDYLGREIALDAIANELSRAAIDVAALQAEFDGVKALLVAAGGQHQIDAYLAHIAAMRAAITAGSAHDVLSQANVGLELVDDMERLFE